MSYEEELAAARERREQEANRKRAEAQVAAEAAAAEKKELGESFLRAITGGITSRTFGEADMRARAKVQADAEAKKKSEAAPKIDPDGDPLEHIPEADREMFARRPYLKKLLREEVEQAEAKAREERESAENREQLDRAHAENDRAREIGRQIAEQRAKARGGT